LGIDIKKGKRGDESLRTLEAEHGPLPKTRKSITASGGSHYVFRMPEGGRKSCQNVRSGIDLLANASYFVAPPSEIDGKAYKWVEDCETAPCPPWLASLRKLKPNQQPADNRISELIRELFPNGRERNGEWEACCSYHDDKKPSL